MEKLLKVLGGLLAALGVLYSLGFGIPGQVHVERQMVIEAQPAEVFAYIGDFRAWQRWSPWATMDPKVAMTLSGQGVGQTMVWDSDNANVGHGSQEVTEFEAPRHMATHLEFAGQGFAEASFDLIPERGYTRVIWSLDTDVSGGTAPPLKPITNYLGLLVKSMIGQQYETGLLSLKTLVERG
ncbi:SRPBCC family protein [Lyngbya confervoides]|uniref:SRPBCC family protein n=1 Tax=Lyngbya confervoides BDU141951 TaxID=1574623 RepID=A0ABD4T218_9CYAN|nr:SRPBCC family protein [Lyngbya confervoides]MCM1982806.1 SRPBCC family protein [Lyngbya confervoides BDU141951]